MALGDLDEVLRRSDPDRWLASRFVLDPLIRADLIALWSYDQELSRAERVASAPLMAEIRLTWWREALDEIFAGRTVRRHPVALALAAAVQRHNLARTSLEAMIDGRLEALDAGPLGPEAAALWASAVGGEEAVAAACILDARASHTAISPAGEVWGLLRLRRSGRARGSDHDRQIRARLTQAARAARGVGPAAFPGIVCATLARGDLGGGEMSALERRARLLWSALSGRL